jgi:hypothetical protein
MKERELLNQVAEVFQEVTGLKGRSHRTKPDQDADVVITAGDRVFVFECKSSGEPQQIVPALKQLRRYGRDQTAVLVVPYMGPHGEELCRGENANWMDLSGNARIIAPGLRVIVRGMPNRFVRRGRPRSLFAPKSARIARLLLLHPREAFTQREIAKRVGLGEGYVSRLVHALLSADLVDRDRGGAVRACDPALLLDAWRDAYDFGKHRIHQAHVVSRSGENATTQVAEILSKAKVPYAATGLSAAWLYAPFAAFRIATFYVARIDAKLGTYGLRTVESGANLWLVEPNDDGVYAEAEERNGVRCVSALQAYLDLKGHPERAKEAADELRRVCLTRIK